VTLLGIDTSVAVPLLLQSHHAHQAVRQWWAGRPVCMVGHALVETYSVLTRLPGDARLAPMDAARLLDARFTAPLTLPAAKARRVPAVFAGLGIAGGAVYDALIGLTAAAHGVPLATRDGRATGTYAAVGAIVVPVG